MGRQPSLEAVLGPAADLSKQHLWPFVAGWLAASMMGVADDLASGRHTIAGAIEELRGSVAQVERLRRRHE